MSHLADFLGSFFRFQSRREHSYLPGCSAARSTPSISCSTLIQGVRLQIARCTSDGCDRSACSLSNRPNMRSDYRRNRSDFLVSGSHGKWLVNLGRRGHDLCGRSRAENGEVRTAYDLQNFEDLHFVRTCRKSHLAQVAHWLQLAETRARTKKACKVQEIEVFVHKFKTASSPLFHCTNWTKSMGTVDFLRANHGTSTIGSLRKGPGLILDGSIIIFPLKVAIKIQSASVRHGQISYRSLYDIYDYIPSYGWFKSHQIRHFPSRPRRNCHSGRF